MTFTIHLWHIMIFLFIFPFIYLHFRKPEGQFDFCLDGIGITILCWSIDIGLLIGKLF